MTTTEYLVHLTVEHLVTINETIQYFQTVVSNLLKAYDSILIENIDGIDDSCHCINSDASLLALSSTLYSTDRDLKVASQFLAFELYQFENRKQEIKE